MDNMEYKLLLNTNIKYILTRTSHKISNLYYEYNNNLII